MSEFVPFLSAFALGTAIGCTSRGLVRTGLTICAVIASGLVATLLSGEYHASWWFLLPDLTESAVGVAAAAATSRFLLSNRSAAFRIAPGLAPNPRSVALPDSRE